MRIAFLKVFIILFVVFIVVKNIIKDDTELFAIVEDSSTYGQNPIKDNWPKLPEGATPLADNLLAANYYIILDGSGSMGDKECAQGQTKLSVAKEAVTSFVKQLPADTNSGLFIFDGRGMSERVPIRAGNQQNLADNISSAFAGGGTPLHAAISQGYKALSNQGVKQLGYGEYNLVVVTDGEASGGDDPRNIVQHMLEESPIVLHTIGFCIGDNHSLNQPGKTYYKAAGDAQALQQGLDAVLAEAPSFNVDSFSGND